LCGLGRVAEAQGKLKEAVDRYEAAARAGGAGGSMAQEANIRAAELRPNSRPPASNCSAVKPATTVPTVAPATVPPPNEAFNHRHGVCRSCHRHLFRGSRHHVICVDNDANKVKMLQAGGIPIYEPGLEELVKKNVAAGRLKFTTARPRVCRTRMSSSSPYRRRRSRRLGGLSYIERVARDIAAAMTSYKIVVDKSTVR